MGYCRGCGCSDRRGDDRGDGGSDSSGGCGDGGGSDSSSGGHSRICCCCDMSGLGIIDGMRMTRYRMTASSGTGGTVGINRGISSSPSPGTSNGCKPHTFSHYRTTLYSSTCRISMDTRLCMNRGC